MTAAEARAYERRIVIEAWRRELARMQETTYADDLMRAVVAERVEFCRRTLAELEAES